MDLQALDPRLTAALHALTIPGLEAFKRAVTRISRNLLTNPPVRAADWIEANLQIPDGPRPGPVKLDIVQRTVASAFQEEVQLSLVGTQGIKDYLDLSIGMERGQPFSIHFPKAMAGRTSSGS